jgi:hypothetical protein
MKNNLFLIETSGLDRNKGVLFADSLEDGKLVKNFYDRNIEWKDCAYYHIYITSDEEIKEGDWVIKISSLYKGGGIAQKYSFIDAQFEDIIFKKIILTTDPDLIKDGVQQISDEFLEWFVKNPSCKSVEIDTYSKKIGVETDANGYREMDVFGKDYKIIIPQEEPKEDWIYNNPQCKQIESCSKSLSKKCICPQKEFKQNTKDEVDKFFVDLVCNKQETLEEVAELATNNPDLTWENKYAKEKFIEGAKSDVARNYWFKIFKEKFIVESNGK